MARFRRGAPWDRFKDRLGYAGLIRALELTYGANGWHPHTHELWFVSADSSVEQEKGFIVERWLKCCIAAGLVEAGNAAQIAAFKLHAVDIKDRCDASDYFAENDEASHWGVDRELTKALSKAGKAAGLHPLDYCLPWHAMAIPLQVLNLLNTPRLCEASASCCGRGA